MATIAPIGRLAANAARRQAEKPARAEQRKAIVRAALGDERQRAGQLQAQNRTLSPTFRGDTSAANVNTIGVEAPMDMTPASTGGGFNTPDGSFNASVAPPLPPGAVYKKGGKVSSASRRGDGIAQRGKTKGRMY